ncbi:hypothetical protein EK21DRAFT_77790 [Setomelanomma holmii]|uniref:DUF6589 domain-containing protein n=1 Tax=Setomelanomma holmii TaxID=210430 RepID=A0A9P4LI76_9PLEO|nr:hypothetical protein EK21DRAFT_77790 [Setomelanomma holmii]
MHNPSVPLRLRDIVTGPALAGTDDVGVQVSRSLIAEAIKRLHPSAISTIFSGDTATSYPQFPVVDRLRPQKTEFWQFAGITADEGTIEGTYQVHEDIYLRQLGLNASATPEVADDFTERLYLVHGDQLTARRIRSVQQEQIQASRAYDRRKWLLGVPAWFHIQMNLLYTIIRTHWQPSTPGQSTVHTVLKDATQWNRSQHSRDSIKYHLMEPIITQGYTSRVASLFYAALRRRSLLSATINSNAGRVDDIEDAMRSLTSAQFLAIIEEIRVAAFTPDAWRGLDADVDYRTMCRYLQEVELFLAVQWAVKYGDIGMLRRLVDVLIVVFLGASQHNYGREMLYYRWILSSANTPELQRAILSSGLVNWIGRPSTFKPIDLALEHLNCHCKVNLRNLKNSTHDISIAFQRNALCNTLIRCVRNQLESQFGETMSGTHSSSVASADMFLLAWQLFVGGYADARHSNSAVSSGMFDSIDLYQCGIDLLEERVDQFNQQHVSNTTTVPRFQAYDEDNESFTDIEAFAEVYHEGYDAIDLPIVDLT